MQAELRDFLAAHLEYLEETQVWGGGLLPLRMRSYLTTRMPPISYVTSVRGVVHRGFEVLVIRDASGTVHITPGGRCEPCELPQDTLRREVLEETGWTIKQPVLLGFTHFHHLAPKPAGYRYPYPDFLQLIYAGQADTYLSDAREDGGYEIEARFVTTGEAAMMPISESQKI